MKDIVLNRGEQFTVGDESAVERRQSRVPIGCSGVFLLCLEGIVRDEENGTAGAGESVSANVIRRPFRGHGLYKCAFDFLMREPPLPGLRNWRLTTSTLGGAVPPA